MILNSIMQSKTWGRFWLFLSLLVLLTSNGVGMLPGQFNTSGVPALVRIDLAGESQLGELRQQGLPVYLQLSTEDGRIILLAPADASKQEQLSRQGYSAEVLAVDRYGAAYYLLYGAPENLLQVEKVARLLFIQDRQAVAQLTPEQADQVAALRLRLRVLVARSLAPAVAERAPMLPASVTPDPLIQSMIDQVSTDTLFDYVGDLSGEWNVPIGGSSYKIATRYTLTSTPIQKATQYAYEHFQTLGLPVAYHNYTLSGTKRNVVAEQVGLTQPERIFVLLAHLDSTSQLSTRSTLAPGADDNASGSAAVMQIADIFSQYPFGCTLRYLLVTGEEQGLVGSAAYAEDASAAGDQIEGVLNLDMVSYNKSGTTETVELHTRVNNSSDNAYANLFRDVITAYQIGLTPTIYHDGESASDHYSFWSYGFPGILAIEDWAENWNYHTTNDQLETLDMGYYAKMTKAALATFAHMGCLLSGGLSGTVTDAGTGDPINGALVQANLDASHLWSTNTLANGAYQFSLPIGSYQVVASAPDYINGTASGVQIVQSQTTYRNFELQACKMREVDFTFSPSFPLPGNTINFSATANASPPVIFSWDFGDGSSDSGQFVTHSYPTTGSYFVKLTVAGSCSTVSLIKAVPVGVYEFFMAFIKR